MKHCFIINPVAGKGNAQDAMQEAIIELARKKGLDYGVYRTTGPGDAARHVREVCETFGEPARFYACGGDGTFQEAVVGTLSFPFAEATVIPCGSGNDFVRSFDHPEWFSDLERQMDGSPVPCDLLTVNDHYAVNLCNVGFDADIAYDMDKFKRLPFVGGSLAYNISLVYNLLKKLGKQFTIQVDGQDEVPVKTLLAAAANGRFYGGGYQAAPLASTNDGIIDLCRVDKLSRFRIAGFVRFYKRGEHLQVEGIKDAIHYEKCRQVRIRSAKPCRFTLDGETYCSNDVTIGILPGGFRLSLPAGCAPEQMAQTIVPEPLAAL